MQIWLILADFFLGKLAVDMNNTVLQFNLQFKFEF